VYLNLECITYPYNCACNDLFHVVPIAYALDNVCRLDALRNGEMRTRCHLIVNSLSSFRHDAVPTSPHAWNGEYSSCASAGYQFCSCIQFAFPRASDLGCGNA